jgi:hypothetical protein
VYDTDPKVATEIAEAHLAYADSFVETYARRRAGLAAAIESRARLEREAQLIEDSLAAIRTEHKIYHLEYLSDVFSQHLLSSGAFQKPGFALHYDKLRALEYRQRLLEEHIADIYNEIIFRQENLTTYPTLLNVVSKPVINREVARPKRSMVLIIAALLGILLGSVTILVYESTQNRQNRA